MAQKVQIPVWRQAPFLRLLLPFVAGIVVQWHFPFSLLRLCFAIPAVVLLLVLLPFLLNKQHLYRTQLTGGLLMVFVFFCGCMLVFYKDVRNHSTHIGNLWQPGLRTRVVISEPLIPKNKSYKTTARVVSVYNGTEEVNVSGTVFIYFKKDSTAPVFQPGDELVFARPLQPIQNNGNPGGMNYSRYCLFAGITHQVFLQSEDVVISGYHQPGGLNRLLWQVRNITLSTLRKYIPGSREQGVAEALLIGYRNDMDRELVQAYSNTGAVHVIAISGMHLGLIYVVLLALFKPLPKNNILRWVKPVTIISILWLFTLVAGAAPSILRSAVMFSCLAVGESLGRKTNVFNTLAASACILLCINPFSLWDVGFRLSYAAVLSIVIFMQPLYRLFTIKNRLADYLWKLNAVTISAQVLTLPVIIFHFHQFPNLFLLSNIVAVPLSGIILMGELVLMGISFFPFAATVLGKATGWLIAVLNRFIEWCGSFPFAVTDGLPMNGWECTILYAVIICGSYWIFKKNYPAFAGTILAIILFTGMRVYAHIVQQQQRLAVVYHVPGQQAVDFISGRHYWFMGSDSLRSDPFLNNFHLKPARIHFNVSKRLPNQLQTKHPFYFLEKKCILLLDSAYRFAAASERLPVDLLVLSRNPKVYIREQAAVFHLKQVVADGSNPQWKINLWKRDCDSLRILFHATGTGGAFVLDCR